jgi:hypothetical protein
MEWNGSIQVFVGYRHRMEMTMTVVNSWTSRVLPLAWAHVWIFSLHFWLSLLPASPSG